MRLLFLILVIAMEPLQANQSLASLMTGLSSSNWEIRAQTAQGLGPLLDADPALLESSELADALTVVLQAENAARQQSFAIGVALPKEQRDYLQNLINPIVDTVLNRTTALPAPFLRAVAFSSYLSDSAFSRGLASLGSPMVPHALELSASDRSIDRDKAYSIFGELIRANAAQSLRTPLTAAEEHSVRLALRGGLQDPTAGGRREAIRAIAIARDLDSLPLLTFLAANDPDTGAGKPAAYPSVRRWALDAIQKLQQ